MHKGEHKTIAIPKLGYPDRGQGPRDARQGRHVLGRGVVLTGIGVGFFAHKKYDDQFPTHCTMKDADKPLCDQAGYRETQQREDARLGRHRRRRSGPRRGGRRRRTLADGTAPRGRTTVSFAPSSRPEQAGVVAFGHF